MEKRDKRLLTVKEVADYLRVNQTTIYRLIRRSEIPAFKLGGDWRFNIESIDAWRLNASGAPDADSRQGSPFAGFVAIGCGYARSDYCPDAAPWSDKSNDGADR